MIEKNINTAILLSIYETAVQLIKKNVAFVQTAGLTNQQWVILIHLAKDPNLPYLIRMKHAKPLMASELAESLGVTRANVTNLINVLLDKDLIEQVEDAEDRRKKRLILSEKGEELIKGMQPERTKSNKDMLEGLTKPQKEQFLEYLQTITNHLIKN